MSQIRSKNTTPEVILRKKLSSNGIKGYRLNYSLPGKPDIVFTRKKLVIFIDGCFWHKCPKCFIRPETNKAFWKKKLQRNIIRDKKINQQLKDMGYYIIRLWEHEIRKDLNNSFLKIFNKLMRKEVEDDKELPNT